MSERTGLTEQDAIEISAAASRDTMQRLGITEEQSLASIGAYQSSDGKWYRITSFRYVEDL